jgi:hypothetical protein
MLAGGVWHLVESRLGAVGDGKLHRDSMRSLTASRRRGRRQAPRIAVSEAASGDFPARLGEPDTFGSASSAQHVFHIVWGQPCGKRFVIIARAAKCLALRWIAL